MTIQLILAVLFCGVLFADFSSTFTTLIQCSLLYSLTPSVHCPQLHHTSALSLVLEMIHCHSLLNVIQIVLKLIFNDTLSLLVTSQHIYSGDSFQHEKEGEKE